MAAYSSSLFSDRVSGGEGGERGREGREERGERGGREREEVCMSLCSHYN